MKPGWDRLSEDQVRPGALDAQPEQRCLHPDCNECWHPKIRVTIEIDVPAEAITDEWEQCHQSELEQLAQTLIASEPEEWIKDASWTAEYLRG